MALHCNSANLIWTSGNLSSFTSTPHACPDVVERYCTDADAYNPKDGAYNHTNFFIMLHAGIAVLALVLDATLTITTPGWNLLSYITGTSRNSGVFARDRSKTHGRRRWRIPTPTIAAAAGAQLSFKLVIQLVGRYN
jgi:hypothetical protein